jgi:hypothetical protein
MRTGTKPLVGWGSRLEDGKLQQEGGAQERCPKRRGRSSPEESVAQVFVSLVDQFTDWHLKILKLFRNPEAHVHTYNLTSNSLAGLIESVYPQLRGQKQFYQQVWRDLYQKGLVRSDSNILFGS